MLNPAKAAFAHDHEKDEPYLPHLMSAYATEGREGRQRGQGREGTVTQ